MVFGELVDVLVITEPDVGVTVAEYIVIVPLGGVKAIIAEEVVVDCNTNPVGGLRTVATAIPLEADDDIAL